MGCIALAVLLCFAGCGQADAKTPAAGLEAAALLEAAEPQQVSIAALSVKGTQLVDAEGKPVQLKGISTHGLAWFPEYINEECFRQLKEDWGINVIRLAMYTAEYGGYCTGGDKNALKELIHKGVDCAEKCGLYVVIDWHILSDGNPNTFLQEAEDFFDEMSKRYAGRTNVLYEICNEPNGGVQWAEVKSYAERILSVIRQNDPDGVVLVGTPDWCQQIEAAAAEPITEFGNVMYTMHFYAATHKESLRGSMAAALEKGLPVFVSEFGICEASGGGKIDTAEAGEWLRLMDERNVSYVAWNLSNKAEASAILQSGCQKKNGFAPKDYSASGRWLQQAFAGKPAAAEVPPAVEVLPVAEIPLAVSGAQEGLSIEVHLAESWEENGKKYGKYILEATNQTAQVKSGWSAELQFDRDVTLVNGWNAAFRTEGGRISISPLEYNKRLEGGAAAEVGFILRSEGEALLLSP